MNAADIPSLVRRLRSSRRTEQLQAMKSLRMLTSHERAPGRCAEVVAAGGVPLLVTLLGCNLEQLRELAAAVLVQLAMWNGPTCAAELHACGGIPAAVALMSLGGFCRGAAAMLLQKIMSGRQYCTAIAAAGGVPLLVPLCTSDEGAEQDSVR